MTAPTPDCCDGPLIWYGVEGPLIGLNEAGGGILECAANQCDYLIVTGSFNDERHSGAPILREGLAS